MSISDLILNDPDYYDIQLINQLNQFQYSFMVINSLSLSNTIILSAGLFKIIIRHLNK